MNAMSKTSLKSDPWARYWALTPSAKIVLQAKCLIVPQVTKNVFQTALARVGLKFPDGKAWNAQTLSEPLEELRRHGLLNEQHHVQKELWHPVAVDAATSPHGETLIARIRKAFTRQGSQHSYYNGPSDPDSLRRLVRLAVYANDLTEFSENARLLEAVSSSPVVVPLLSSLFGDQTLDLAWLTGLHPALQNPLLSAKMEAFFSTGVPPADISSILSYYRSRQHEAGLGGVAWTVMYHDLLAGRLDEVKSSLPKISPTNSGIMELLFEAALAFFSSNDELANRQYREALKRYRKGLGKRAVFLPGTHGLFFCLVLLRSNNAAYYPDIQSGIEVAGDTPSWTTAYQALQAMLWLVQGQPAAATELLAQVRKKMPSEPIPAAVIALAEYAVDASISRKHHADLVERFKNIAEPLPLIARIYAEILAEISPSPKPYEKYLAERTPGVAMMFTHIIASRPNWERALQSLDVLLGGGPADAGKEQRKSKRLVWFVDPDKKQVEVVEQSSKRDGWTDGRPVSLKRLHERDPKLDYLIEQDRPVLRAIRTERNPWRSSEVGYDLDPLAAIIALVGHPQVFDARKRSQSIELVAYPLELIVTAHKGGYRVALSHSAVEPTVFVEQETPTRYRVIEFPQKMLAVQAVVGARGLIMPEAARDQLVALIKRNHPALPVRDEIGAVADAAIEGVPNPVVQCKPFEAGLNISLLVRPFGAEGPAYVAGSGGRSVLAMIAGRQVRANRDLDVELAKRRALIDACPTLRDRISTDGHELVVEDLEGCLELLVELAVLEEPAVIEWPEGHKMQVTHVTPQKMKLRVARDRDWFSVEGSVALDAEQVVEMRYLLERLDRAQGRFIPLDDGRFIALTRQLQAQLKAFAAVSEPHKTGRRVHALGATALEAVLEQAGDVKADVAWKRHVTNIRSAEGWTPKLPPFCKQSCAIIK